MKILGRPVNSTFTKLQIRRAMRSLGAEAQLDALLASNAIFAADWADAQIIDLSDAITAQALQGAAIDVDAVRQAIYTAKQ